ncbi:unnamed protein product, partial [Urochloa humidicola]
PPPPGISSGSSRRGTVQRRRQPARQGEAAVVAGSGQQVRRRRWGSSKQGSNISRIDEELVLREVRRRLLLNVFPSSHLNRAGKLGGVDGLDWIEHARSIFR